MAEQHHALTPGSSSSVPSPLLSSHSSEPGHPQWRTSTEDDLHAHALTGSPPRHHPAASPLAPSASAATASLPASSPMQRSESSKRREGERDDSEPIIALPAAVASALSHIVAPPLDDPPTPASIAVAASSSSVAPSDPKPAAVVGRASVEDSPDGKWARYKRSLGSGTFKDVYLAVDTESGKEVAWNVISLDRVSAKDRQRITAETELLKTLRHPNIICIHDVWTDEASNKVVFITERSAYTLKQHISNLHPAKKSVIKRYCREILTALAYLHSLSPPVIHRDLKCDNIFISSSTGSCVLGDFGLATAKESATSLIGTPGFLAPELFSESYSTSVDIWAFGMCVFEMATNSFPYVECNGVVSLLLKRGFEGVKPEGLAQISDPALREFILMCLQPVEKRMSAQQLLEQKVYDLSEAKKPVDNGSGGGASANSAAASMGLDVRIPHALDASAVGAGAMPATPQQRSDLANPHAAAASAVTPSAGLSVQPATPAAAPDAALSSTSASSAKSKSSQDAALLAAQRQEALRRCADVLIPKTAVAKTDSPSVVSIFLYARLKEPAAHLHALMAEAVSSIHPPPPAPDVPDLSRLLLVDVPVYDFTKDNYLAVATSLIKARADLSAASAELDAFEDVSSAGGGGGGNGKGGGNDATSLFALDQLIAFKIEQCVHEKYEKFSARARTTLNSEIMSLLTSLGMNLSVAAKFIEQEVTYEDLFLLSDADLMEFIPKLGPRRRLQQYLESQRKSQQQMHLYHANAAAAAAQQASSDHEELSSADERERPRKKGSLISTGGTSSTASNGSASAAAAPKEKKERKSTRERSSSSAAIADASAAPVKRKEKTSSKPKTEDRASGTAAATDASSAVPAPQITVSSSPPTPAATPPPQTAVATSAPTVAAPTAAAAPSISSSAASSPSSAARAAATLVAAAPAVSSAASPAAAKRSGVPAATVPSVEAAHRKTSSVTAPAAAPAASSPSVPLAGSASPRAAVQSTLGSRATPLAASPAAASNSVAPTSSAKASGVTAQPRFFDQNGDAHMNALLNKIHFELQPSKTAAGGAAKQPSTPGADSSALSPLTSSASPPSRAGLSVAPRLPTMEAGSSPDRARRSSGGTAPLSMAALAAAHASAASASSSARPASRPHSPLQLPSAHAALGAAFGSASPASSISVFMPHRVGSQGADMPAAAASPLSSPMPSLLHADEYPAFNAANSRLPLHASPLYPASTRPH